jgi:hypothetical protein
VLCNIDRYRSQFVQNSHHSLTSGVIYAFNILCIDNSQCYTLNLHAFHCSFQFVTQFYHNPVIARLKHTLLSSQALAEIYQLVKWYYCYAYTQYELWLMHYVLSNNGWKGIKCILRSQVVSTEFNRLKKFNYKFTIKIRSRKQNKNEKKQRIELKWKKLKFNW